MTESWPVTRSWDAAAEAEFGRWVQTIGRAVEARRCRTLASCLDSPAINPLYVSGRRSTFRADCADVPYILRAYFAWRRQLPFVHTAAVRGESASRDGRYAYTNRPASTRRWSDYATPRQAAARPRLVGALGLLPDAPRARRQRHLPRARRPRRHPPRHGLLRPRRPRADRLRGAPDGEIRLIDGHPGGSFTARRFSSQLTLGSSRQGGGFRNFRPMLLRRGAVTRPRNAELADYDAMVQHDPSRWVVRGRQLGYHDWVRVRLGAPLRPALRRRRRARSRGPPR
jgi:hypothetical protein